jgi:hypothetical protein
MINLRDSTLSAMIRSLTKVNFLEGLSIAGEEGTQVVDAGLVEGPAEERLAALPEYLFEQAGDDMAAGLLSGQVILAGQPVLKSRHLVGSRRLPEQPLGSQFLRPVLEPLNQHQQGQRDANIGRLFLVSAAPLLAKKLTRRIAAFSVLGWASWAEAGFARGLGRRLEAGATDARCPARMPARSGWPRSW